MIYPKSIQDWILRENPGDGAFEKYTFPGDLNKTAKALHAEDFSLEIWLKREGCARSEAVREYFHFLRTMADRFAAINRKMGYLNESASHRMGHDQWATGWAGPGMLPVALYLSYLHSFGIRGKVLECGVFKGGSTCCLSWVCDFLGLKLLAADSFSGLPGSEGHYGKGDFKGSLEEAYDNVSRFGKVDRVEFIQGLYSESLQNLGEDLMLIWLDVDLKQSVLDALRMSYPRLACNGVIFSDGVVDVVDFSGDSIRDGGGEPAGLHQFFKENDIPYKAKPAGPKGLCLIVPNCLEGENIIYQSRKHDILAFN